MKIRKAIKLAVAGAVAAAPLSMAVAMNDNKGPMTGEFGQWESTGGAGTGITLSCPTGYTCATAAVTDAGFIQRTITDGDGRQFIQTIVADGTGSFSSQGNSFFGDESFVMLNGQGGISGQNQIRDNTGAGDFTSKSNLNTGSEFMSMGSTANAGTLGDGSMVELSQGITDTEFASTFEFDHGMLMMGEGGGKFASLTLSDYANDSAAGFASSFKLQNNDLEDNTNTTTQANFIGKKVDVVMDLNTTDISQDFAVKTRAGSGAVGNGEAFFSVGTSSNVAFSQGDSIYKMDLGQSVTGAGDFGMGVFRNDTAGTQGKAQSLTSSAIPFVTVSDDQSPGGDPFATF